jgi:quaternary ammonium compound-resistance protein SugE
MNTAWIYLMVAGALEIGFTTSLNLSQGFTRWPFVGTFLVCAMGSFYFLSRATATIPLGTAYAVWTGIGAFGTALVGILAFDEPASAPRIVFLSLLISSIVGLKLFS